MYFELRVCLFLSARQKVSAERRAKQKAKAAQRRAGRRLRGAIGEEDSTACFAFTQTELPRHAVGLTAALHVNVTETEVAAVFGSCIDLVGVVRSLLPA